LAPVQPVPDQTARHDLHTEGDGSGGKEELQNESKGGSTMKKSNQSMTVTLFSLALLAVTCLPVWAKPLISVTLTTSKEAVEVKDGVRTVKMVPAKSAVSGDVLHYTLAYTNKGNEAATNAVIDNPVPKGTVYIANSATGDNSEITFYAPPAKLTYEVKLPSGKTEKRMATPGDYTNIRWKVKSVAPAASGTVGFSVQIK